jgi:hypothetical protein
MRRIKTMAESKDDLASRKARAKRLEDEIEEVVAHGDSGPASPKTPRDFIHQRMAELAADEKSKAKNKHKK